jgi:hypothetical protein
MAFNDARWTRQTLAFNSGAVVVDGPATENGPALFTYASATDNAAAIAAADYFAPAVYDLAVGDIILALSSTTNAMLVVATVDRDAETVTTAAF